MEDNRIELKITRIFTDVEVCLAKDKGQDLNILKATERDRLKKGIILNVVDALTNSDIIQFSEIEDKGGLKISAFIELLHPNAKEIIKELCR